MVTKSGIKLLDFGLAKQHEASSPDSSTAQQVSEEGTIVGTVQYMAPEVFRGQEADARTDIFALGLILFEMATGKPAFGGNNKAEVIAAILDRDVPTVENSLGLDRLVRACVAKDPDLRLRSAFDASLTLKSIVEAASRPPASRARVVSSAVAVVAIIVAATFAWKSTRRSGETIRHGRFQLQPPAGVVLSDPLGAASRLAISPNGEWVAFRAFAGPNKTPGLYLRSINQLDAQLVSGSSISAFNPFFSPDSKWLAFFAYGAMWKVAVPSGQPTKICDVPRLRGATWSTDGTIVFCQGNGLRRVSADGGRPSDLTTPPESELHYWPQFLPDNKHLLLTILRGTFARNWRVAVMSLDDLNIRELAVGSYARYVSGYVYFAYGGTLFSLPFDVRRAVATGPPKAVLDDVHTQESSGVYYFDLAADGSLVYTPGAPRVRDSELVWVDRHGNTSRAVDDVRPYSSVILSPDQHKIAAVIDKSVDESDLWIFDRDHATWAKLTSGTAVTTGAWMPDGKSFIFSGGDTPQLFRVSVDGTGKPDQLTFGPNQVTNPTVSPAGKVAVFQRQIGAGMWHIFSIALDRPRSEERFLTSKSGEALPQFSPDGQWLAYASDEAGFAAVSVRPFPAREPRITVSEPGGDCPVWSPNGQELFYRKDKEIWAVAIDTRNGFHASKPQRLFAAEWLGTTVFGATLLQPTLDGKKFLMIRESMEAHVEPRLVYAPRWIDELKQ